MPAPRGRCFPGAPFALCIRHAGDDQAWVRAYRRRRRSARRRRGVKAGRLDEAERLYTLVLSTHPLQIDALHLLGVVAMQRGRFDEAERLIGRTVAL